MPEPQRVRGPRCGGGPCRAGAVGGKHPTVPGPALLRTLFLGLLDAARDWAHQTQRRACTRGSCLLPSPPPLRLPLAPPVSFLPSKLTGSGPEKPLSFLSWNLPRERHLCFCFDFCAGTVLPEQAKGVVTPGQEGITLLGQAGKLKSERP